MWVRSRHLLPTGDEIAGWLLSLIAITAGAEIVVPPDSAIGVDEATVQSAVALFEQAKQVIKSHDPDTVMTKSINVRPGRQAVAGITCTAHLRTLLPRSGLPIPIDSYHQAMQYRVIEMGQLQRPVALTGVAHTSTRVRLLVL